MTKKRRFVLAIGLLVLTANFVWIPWVPPVVPGVVPRVAMDLMLQHLRGGFIWSGPKTYPTDDYWYLLSASGARPNVELLMLRTLAMLGVWGAILLLMPPKQPSKEDA